MEWLSKALLSLFLLMSAHMVSAQDEPIVVLNETDTIRPTKYIAPLTEKPKLALFQGLTLSADILGPIIYLFSDYGSTDYETDITYSTSAPFFRAGIDFNILKNKLMDNRLYVGARYGISSFKFDMSGPVMTDPIWGGSSPYNYRDAASTSSWLEIVFGAQVKVWRNFHMGWSVRYKQELHIGQPSYAKPYYIPGYGTTTDTSCWGGTYNLIFDLNWGKKKHAKQSPSDSPSATKTE